MVVKGILFTSVIHSFLMLLSGTPCRFYLPASVSLKIGQDSGLRGLIQADVKLYLPFFFLA